MTQDVPNRLGNYRLLREIGRGGFATVFLAKHIHLKHHAAVKVLTSVTETELFRQEAQTIMELSHPNIVRVFDFGIEGGTAFIVMDYAPYGSLRLQYPHRRVMPIESVMYYSHQVAAALQHAHNRKIIHRDVKPENMLLGAHRRVLLSDFGIALIGQGSRTQDVAGTIAYMAPEQIQGKPRQASDQYALAITVYEWLCGRRPFEGTISEITTQHLGALPPPPRIYAPSISPDIEAVILRALEKEPRRRFPTVMEFADTLREVAGGVMRKPKDKHFVMESASSGTVRRDQEQAIIRTTRAKQPSALPSLKSQRRNQRGLPVTNILDKKSKNDSLQEIVIARKTGISKKTIFTRILAISGILSVLILSVSILVPKISYSPLTDGRPTPPLAHPEVTPTRQEVTPTSPPSTPSPPPSSKLLPITDLGTLNISDYCRVMGNRASLDQNNAYGWRCVTPSGNHTLIDTDAACQSQYNTQAHVLARMVNYSDPNNWHCYSPVKNLGGIDMNQYCQSIGKQAHLNGSTVYDWHCVDVAGNSVLIDVDTVCRWQYSESDALSSVSNYFDPQGWICLGRA